MEMNEILTFDGLMRRSGHLAVGADDVAESCAKGRAHLVLLPKGTSANTVKWMESAVERKEVPILRPGMTKKDLGEALGVGSCAVAAVCDTGLAIALSKKLEMAELTAQLEQKLAREKRRKAKKLAGKANSPKRGK
jgi:ribosomal protein L7Ae-like RNA K-turn-binding protein